MTTTGDDPFRGNGGNMGNEIQIAEDDAEAARLRSIGASYPEIARQMRCSLSTAHRRVQRAIRAIRTEGAIDLREIESRRLDDLWKILWREATRDHVIVQGGKVVTAEDGTVVVDAGPKIQAARALITLMERRARLFGLDEPTKQRIEVVTEDAVDAEIRRLEAEIAEREAFANMEP